MDINASAFKLSVTVLSVHPKHGGQNEKENSTK
jgi:hypothetical protein